MSHFPLLSLNPRQRSTRDLVFGILATQFPLTLAELHRALIANTRLRISYQGVRRAVLLMKRDGVLLESEAGFRLNPAWLEAAKTTLDVAYEVARGASSRRFNFKELSQRDYKFSCSSLYEADIVWGDLLFAYAASKTSEKPQPMLSLNHSAWALLFNTGREVELFRRLKAIGMPTTMVFSEDNIFNRQALRAYKQIGCDAYIDRQLKMATDVCWNVTGDFVIQVQLNRQIAEKLIDLMRKSAGYDAEMRSALLANSKAKVDFTLQLNPALARQLRTLTRLPKKRK